MSLLWRGIPRSNSNRAPATLQQTINTSSNTVVLFILVLLTLSCLFCESVTGAATTSCNRPGLYYNSSSNSCSDCTNCSLLGLNLLTECTLYTDTVCSCPSGHYYDNSTLSCNECTDCHEERYQPVGECTATSNTICVPCPTDYFYSLNHQRCVINCKRCPNSGVCAIGNPDQCRCLRCQIGPFCKLRDPSCDVTTSTEPPSTPTTLITNSDDQSLSPISSALVAIGAVFGIIVFTTCFVLLGVVNSCRKTPNTSSDSSSSSSGTNVGSAITSSSLASLYNMNGHSPSPLQEYRTSLDILKYSNNSIYSNSSNGWTNGGSPLSSRSNSAPLV